MKDAAQQSDLADTVSLDVVEGIARRQAGIEDVKIL